MKKRVLSLILVLVLIVSLVPATAFASLIDDLKDLVSPDPAIVTITQQPLNAFARVGDTVTFTIEAETDPTNVSVRYLWVNRDKISRDYLDSLETKLGNLVTGATAFDNIADAIIGREKTLTMTVDKAMTIACLVYVFDLQGKELYYGLALSDDVFISINNAPICQSHDISYPTMQYHAASQPNCMHTGSIEYYYCTLCEQYFVFKNGQLMQSSAQACTIPKTNTHKLSYYNAKEGDCATAGMPQYWQCDDCMQYFKDAAGTQATTLSELQGMGTKNPNKHDAANIEHHSAKRATCAGDGNYEYWYCKGCQTYFLDGTLTTGSKYETYVIDYKNEDTPHGTIKHMDARNPGCETQGNYEYYYCAVCGACFDDPDGKMEVNKELLMIPATGHNYQMTADALGHQQYCDKCKTSTQKEAHYGGTATCHSLAVCDACGREYGSKDMTNHTRTRIDGALGATVDTEGNTGNVFCLDCDRVVQYGKVIPKLCQHTINSDLIEHKTAVDATCQHAGNCEYWHCTQCDKYWSNSMLTVEVARANVGIPQLQHFINGAAGQTRNPVLVVGKFNSTQHWDECMYCGMEFSGTRKAHMLTNLTPTCCSCNYCVECDFVAGDYDYKNHSGQTELVNYRDPTDTTPGYTGDTKCLGCGEIIATGKAFYNVCPAGNCRFNLEYIPEIPATCTEDGVKAHYKCRMCEHLYKDEFAATPINSESDVILKTTGHELHPNTDDLKNMLSVDGLKNILGSNFLVKLLGSVVSGETPNFDDVVEMLHVSDFDHCSDDHYHWMGCQKCGKTLAELSPELADIDISVSRKVMELSAKQPHYGGTATCQSRAKCVECGDYYGDYAQHDYYENNVCATCGKTVKGCAAPKMSISYAAKTAVATIKWTEVADAGKYELWYAKSKNGIYSLAYEGDDVSYLADFTGYGTSFYFKVRARGTDGSYGAYTEPMLCQKKCTAPTISVSNNTTTGKIKLTWTKVDGATKYEVYRATSKNGTFKKLGSTTGTSYTNTSSVAGSTYYYKVRAIDKGGTASAYSNVLSRCCDCAKPVVKISNVASSGAIKLTWSAVSGADKYYVYRATSSSGTYTKIKTTTSTSFTNTSTTVGKKYYYKVKAVSNKSSSSLSAYSDVVYRIRDCARPTIHVGIWSNKPYVMWDEIDGADKYVVYRATSKNGEYTKLATTTKLNYNDKKAKAGKTYYYKVVAVSNKTTSANSAKSNISSCKSK